MRSTNQMGSHREFDETEILRLREKRKKEKYNSIEKGIYIQSKVEQFVPTIFFEGKLSIMIPESFGIMPEEYQRTKYPSHFRPDMLVTSADLNTNMGFNYFTQTGTEEELEAQAFQIKSMLQRSDPSIQFYGRSITDTANCRKVWFDFRTQAMDEAVYNIHFLTLIGGKLMYGIFNCLYRHMGDWRAAAVQMIESVTDLTR